MITEQQLQQMLARTAPHVRDSGTVLEQPAVERESDLHLEIISYCRNRGWIVFHGSMAHRAMRTLGEPDVIAATDDGRTIYAEIKRPGSKPTPQQQAMLHWLVRNKQIAGVVHSLAEFVELSGKGKV